MQRYRGTEGKKKSLLLYYYSPAPAGLSNPAVQRAEPGELGRFWLAKGRLRCKEAWIAGSKPSRVSSNASLRLGVGLLSSGSSGLRVYPKFYPKSDLG